MSERRPFGEGIGPSARPGTTPRGLVQTIRSIPPALQLFIFIIVLVLLYSYLPRLGGLLIFIDFVLWTCVVLGVLYSSGDIVSAARSVGLHGLLGWLVASPIEGAASGSAAPSYGSKPHGPAPSSFGSSTPPPSPSSPAAKPAPKPASGNSLEILRRNIVQSIDNALLGQKEAAELIGNALTRTFSERRSGPYQLVIAGGAGSGRTTMLVQLRDCLTSAEIAAEFVHASDPPRGIVELIRCPVLLIDDLDKQPASVCAALAALVKGRPDGPKLIVFATRDGMPVNDPLVQPIPEAFADQERMLHNVAGLAASRINSLVTPRVPSLDDMIALANGILMTRCKGQSLWFDAEKSKPAIISMLAAPHEHGLASHPGTWISMLETRSDQQLAYIARQAGPSAKKVALMVEDGEAKLRKVA